MVPFLECGHTRELGGVNMISCSTLNKGKLITVGSTAYIVSGRKWQVIDIKNGYVTLMELYRVDRKVNTKKISTRVLIARYLLD